MKWYKAPFGMEENEFSRSQCNGFMQSIDVLMKIERDRPVRHLNHRKDETIKKGIGCVVPTEHCCQEGFGLFYEPKRPGLIT